ncbi:MAG: sulfotransferase [bacterium]|nr:sulfotransferase [bacterium]
MGSGFPVLVRLLKLTLFHSRGSHARFTWRRFGVLCAFVPVFVIAQIVHRIAFLLDDLFFPGYRSIEIEEPVFILGIPRSGTTFLHRVLSKDTENFTTMDLWEMVLAPAVIERKFFLALGAIDRALGGFGYRIVKAADTRIFASVRKIHKVSFLEPEEDDLVLFPIFASIFLLFAFPFPEAMWHLAHFDTQTPVEHQQRIMTFYRDCVKRHLYVHGTDRHFLSKNPAFSPKVDALNEYFPDGKAVCSVRRPYEAIPSLMSFLTFSWERFDNDPQGLTFRDMVLDMAGNWYRHPMNRFPLWPDERYSLLKYDTLVGDPRAAIEALYDKFGLEVGPEFADVLEAERQKSLTYESKHKYSLAQYELTPQKILEDFGDIFDHFRFDRTPPISEGDAIIPLEQAKKAG